MKLLLDTHLLLWAVHDSSRLSPAAKRWMADPQNSLHFSVATIWEVAIKFSRRRPDFHADPKELRQELLAHGYGEIEISGTHAAAVASLEPIHKDPFDRILVAQAAAEGFCLLTSDVRLARYGRPVELV